MRQSKGFFRIWAVFSVYWMFAMAALFGREVYLSFVYNKNIPWATFTLIAGGFVLGPPLALWAVGLAVKWVTRRFFA
jgi:hypothetical protein